MYTISKIRDILFQGFTLEAAKKIAVFSPDSGEIILGYCNDGAFNLRNKATLQFDSKTSQANWITDQLLEIRSDQIQKAVRRMVTSAKARQDESKILQILEVDTRPIFKRLCPGFFPFC